MVPLVSCLKDGDVMKKTLIIVALLFIAPFLYSAPEDTDHVINMVEITPEESETSRSEEQEVSLSVEELNVDNLTEPEAIERLSQINFDREVIRSSGTYTHTRFFALLRNNEIKYIVCAFFLGAVLIGIIMGPYYFNNCYPGTEESTTEEQKRLLEMGETVLSLTNGHNQHGQIR